MKLLDPKVRHQRMKKNMEEIEEEIREYFKSQGLPYDEDESYDENESYNDLEEEREAEKIWHEKIVDEFVSSHMCSKDDILYRLDGIVRDNSKKLENLKAMNELAFYKTYISLLMKFRTGIENLVLMDKLDDFWAYGFEMDEDGIRLQLLAFSYPDIDGKIDFDVKQEYVLYTVKPQMLTIEEYAVRYGVKAVTVRQWIRRGKIRTAKKLGKEWRISELLEPQGRGYQSGFYSWNVDLEGVPKEWDFINDFEGVQIDQLCAGKYLARFEKKDNNSDWPYQEYEIDESERAKLELFLISHPFVKGKDNSSFGEGYW